MPTCGTRCVATCSTRVSRIETACDQEGMFKLGEMVGSREGRLDIGIAAAGILPDPAHCLDIRGEDLQAVPTWLITRTLPQMSDDSRQVMATNAHGALFTAQAAGRQMRRSRNGGSIILIASIAGREAFQVNGDHL